MLKDLYGFVWIKLINVCFVSHYQLTGNTYHKDKSGRVMPVIVRGDPNKPRAEWKPPSTGNNSANQNAFKPLVKLELPSKEDQRAL